MTRLIRWNKTAFLEWQNFRTIFGSFLLTKEKALYGWKMLYSFPNIFFRDSLNSNHTVKILLLGCCEWKLGFNVDNASKLKVRKLWDSDPTVNDCWDNLFLSTNFPYTLVGVGYKVLWGMVLAEIIEKTDYFS